MTKDFAYAVARVAVAYDEDIDRVAEILRGVCDELSADEQLGPWILDPFDYQGIDSLNEFSVAPLLRVRTVAGKQFAVGRALNRLIKLAFEKHGIAMRDPTAIVLASPTAPSAGNVSGSPSCTGRAGNARVLPTRPENTGTPGLAG